MTKKGFHRGREIERRRETESGGEKLRQWGSQYQGNNIKETQGVKIKRKESVAKAKDVSLFLFLQIKKCIISAI